MQKRKFETECQHCTKFKGTHGSMIKCGRSEDFTTMIRTEFDEKSELRVECFENEIKVQI